MTKANWIDRRPGGKFPEKFRFEIRPVFAPLPIGTWHALAAICDEPRTVVWLRRLIRAGMIECHVVTEAMWVTFSTQDDELDLLKEFMQPQRSQFPEWRINRDTMSAWDPHKGQGTERSMPDHLLPMNSTFHFSELDDQGRRKTIRLVQPILDWWPQLYSRDKVVLPNPVKRRIEYGPLEHCLAQPDAPSKSLITGRRNADGGPTGMIRT